MKKNTLKSTKVLWLTGLSGSGKSTIAYGLQKRMDDEDVTSIVLDGDILRKGLNKDLGFTLKDRKENIRRVAEIAKLLKNSGILTIVSFISPTEEIRDVAKKIIRKEDFVLIYVDCSLEVCVKRDAKGLYKKAISGEIKDFTGISSPFEKPKSPSIIINTGILSEEQSIQKILDFINKIV